MPPQPAPVIQRFADGDAVQPGLQRTAAPESPDAAKRLEKDILRDVGCVAGLRDHPGNEAVNRARIVRHQPVECRAGSALQLRHEFGFVLRPGKDARQVRHVYRLSCLRAPGDVAEYSRQSPCVLRNRLGSRSLGLPTGNPSAEKRRLVSSSLDLDTVEGEWFPLPDDIVRFEYRVCNGTGEVELGCRERS